jgi:hypothetical protein
MKGKITFTRHEAEIIQQTLDQVRRADRATQKRSCNFRLQQNASLHVKHVDNSMWLGNRFLACLRTSRWQEKWLRQLGVAAFEARRPIS